MVIDYFVKWVQTARVSERAAAAAALARSYCGDELSFEDRCAAEAALTFLLDDPSARVRAAMADVLSLSRNAPPQIIAALAADQPEVAGAVIARSPLLGDADLIERIAAGGEATQALVANRPQVSMGVCAALAEVGEPGACLALIGNEGAEIASVSFRRIAERFGHRADVREALIAHALLPSDCRHTLLLKLAEAFQASPLLAAVIGGDRAERVVRDACQKSCLTLIEGTRHDEHPALVEHLRLRGELTSGFLVRALAHGRVDFFGAALVQLSGQALPRVRRLLASGHDAALTALFRQAGLGQPIHAVLLRALKAWREVAQARSRIGTQEVSFLMLQELGGATAGGQLAALVKAIHLDALRVNARNHALALAAA